MDYEYTELYYATPCQVRFYDAENGEFCGGIALQDFVISGMEGDIIPIEKIIRLAEEDGIHWDDAVVELEWVDIEELILSGKSSH